MPYLKTYEGRPVTHMKREGTQIVLTFANAAAGEQKERRRVTQSEWDRHGTTVFVDKLPDVRKMQ